MKVVATGHRPPRLGGYSEEARLATIALARKSLLKLDDVEHVICGMAQGWDQAVAEACLDLAVPWTAALPFLGMGDRWPDGARQRRDALLRKAARIEVVGGGEGSYSSRFIVRDHWMVESVRPGGICLALWDGSRTGGTFATILHAELRSVKIVNVWPDVDWIAA